MHPFKPTPVRPETIPLALLWERVVALAGRSATNSLVLQNLLVLPILLLLLLLVRILLLLLLLLPMEEEVVVIALLMVTGILACLLAAAGVARIKLAVRSEKG